MKKYTPRAAKWMAVTTLICGAILLAGIILAFMDVANIVLPIVLISSGGLSGIIFLSCYFAEKSRTLIIDTDKIIFPRGADKDGKIVFRKTVIKMSEIHTVERKFHKGDKIISDDCFFYTMRLKDGTTITVTLYAYGKETEKEIFKTIQEGLL